jgi:hypothetical protein
MDGEARIFAIIAFITLVVCASVWFLGRWLVRWLTHSKHSRLASISVTRAGFICYTIQVLLMVGAVVLFKLFPESSFALWLSHSPGLALGLFVIICGVFGGVLAAVFGRRGIKLLEFTRRDA